MSSGSEAHSSPTKVLSRPGGSGSDSLVALLDAAETWADERGYPGGALLPPFRERIGPWQRRRVFAAAIFYAAERRKFVRRVQPHRGEALPKPLSFSTEDLDPWGVEAKGLREDSFEIIHCDLCMGTGEAPGFDDGGATLVTCDRCESTGRIERWWAVESERVEETEWFFEPPELRGDERARMESAFAAEGEGDDGPEAVGAQVLFSYDAAELFSDEFKLPLVLRDQVTGVIDGHRRSATKHGDRLRRHRIQVLELDYAESIYRLKGREGRLRFVGDPLIDAGSDAQPIEKVLSERAPMRTASLLGGALGLGACAAYALRGEWFQGWPVAVVAALVLGSAIAGLMRAHVRRFLNADETPVSLAVGVPAGVAAALGVSVGLLAWNEPSSSKALALAEAGDLDAARRAVTALGGRGDAAELRELEGRLRLAEAEASQDEEAKLAALAKVPADSSLAAEAQQQRDGILMARAVRLSGAGNIDGAVDALEGLSNDALRSAEGKAAVDQVHARGAKGALAQQRWTDAAGHLEALSADGAARANEIVLTKARSHHSAALSHPEGATYERLFELLIARYALNALPSRFAPSDEYKSLSVAVDKATAPLQNARRLLGAPLRLAELRMNHAGFRSLGNGRFRGDGISLDLELAKTQDKRIVGAYIYDWGDDGVQSPGLSRESYDPLITLVTDAGVATQLRKGVPREPGEVVNQERQVRFDGRELRVVLMTHDRKVRGITLGDFRY